jgi:hypothetical protein
VISCSSAADGPERAERLAEADVEAGTVVVVECEDDVLEVVSVSLASALASVFWAEARLAWADTTLASSSVMSREARVSPAVTFCPTDTSTALTVPDTLKLRSAWFTGVIVPTDVNESTTVPLLTSAVR